MLFHLTADPTESRDLCKQQPEVCGEMKAAMDQFTTSIQHSRIYESECAEAVPTPPPTPPVTGGFELELTGGPGTPGECLAVQVHSQLAGLFTENGLTDCWLTGLFTDNGLTYCWLIAG